MTRVTELLDKGAYEGLYDLLKELKRSADDAKEKAGERGTAVHHAAEQYAMFGAVPNPQEYPHELRGYIRALAQWILEEQPVILASEQRVGSISRKFAGTYDLRFKQGDRLLLGDYKTSKRPYGEHFAQLGLYNLAAQECGEEPADALAVINIREDGEYDQFTLEADSELVHDAVLEAALTWYRGITALSKWVDDQIKRRR